MERGDRSRQTKYKSIDATKLRSRFFQMVAPEARCIYTGAHICRSPSPPPAAAVPLHFTQREAPNLICPASENPRIDFIRSGLLFEVHSSKLFFFFLDRWVKLSFSLILISFDNSNSFNNISKFSNSFNNSNSNR